MGGKFLKKRFHAKKIVDIDGSRQDDRRERIEQVQVLHQQVGRNEARVEQEGKQNQHQEDVTTGQTFNGQAIGCQCGQKHIGGYTKTSNDTAIEQRSYKSILTQKLDIRFWGPFIEREEQRISVDLVGRERGKGNDDHVPERHQYDDQYPNQQESSQAVKDKVISTHTAPLAALDKSSIHKRSLPFCQYKLLPARRFATRLATTIRRRPITPLNRPTAVARPNWKFKSPWRYTQVSMTSPTL